MNVLQKSFANVTALPFINKALYNNTPVKEAVILPTKANRHGQRAGLRLDLI
jgi:hypothetical protein